MELLEETPNNKNLHKLPYSELKKLAKKHGIKGNMKAEKIIAAINSLNSSAMESFYTPEQEEINSSKKNKEDKFDVDQATPLATPKRGTYSLDTPLSLKADEISSAVADTSLLDMSNVTISRGSERKLRSRKVSFVSPVLAPSTPKNSNLRLRPKTPVASRVSLGKRVSFSTPASQRKKSSEKTFPTTPLPKLSFSEENSAFNSRASGKDVSTPLPCIEEVSKKDETMDAFEDIANTASENLLQKDDEQLESVQTVVTEKEVSAKNKETTTPGSVKPLTSKKDTLTKIKQAATPSSVKSTLKRETSTKNKQAATPGSVKPVLKREASTRNKQAVTPGSTKTLVLKNDTASKLKWATTPSSTKKLQLKNDTASKLKRIATPNFKKIHQKMFQKMESIDDYQKRKVFNTPKMTGMCSGTKTKVTKAKSKIPCFSGIPFVPSLSSSKIIGPLQNDKKQKVVSASDSVKESKKAAPKRNKSKFDLKASLSRKLGYKPYKGPLKPLAESNLNISTTASVHNHVPERVNKVVATKRMETRSLIRGVRTNKRFELQMKNRKLE